MDKYTFFYGGVFSQWYHSEFEVDGVTYQTAEQYMMAGKARLFNDDVVLAKILATSSPHNQKALGRQVKGRAGGKWDAEDVAFWNSKARDIVYEGSYAKFTQNEGLKEALLATGDSLLVEASPTDRLWGIGLAEGDPACEDESKWRGVNWLGEVLTKVREDIKAGVKTTENFGWSDNIHIYEQAPPI